MFAKLIICLHIISSIFIYGNYGLTSTIKKYQQSNFDFPDEPQTDPQGFPPQGGGGDSSPQAFPPQGGGDSQVFGFPDEQQQQPSIFTSEDCKD